METYLDKQVFSLVLNWRNSVINTKQTVLLARVLPRAGGRIWGGGVFVCAPVCTGVCVVFVCIRRQAGVA